MMKNKFFSLLKVNIINSYKLNKFFKSSNLSSKLFGIICLLFIAGFIAGLSFLYSTIIFAALKNFNLERYLPILFYFVTELMIFIFSIYKVKPLLFDPKDNDLLFSLPIKQNSILRSRICNLLIFNYIMSILIFLTSFIAYIVFSKISMIYVLHGILISIILPILPTILACVIGYFIAYISSKVTHKNLIETVLTISFFMVILVSSIFIQKIGMLFVNNIESIDIVISKFMFNLNLVKEIISGNIICEIIYVFINIAIFMIFTFLLSKGYGKITNKLKESKVKNVNKKVEFKKKNSQLICLIKKEAKKFFSIPIYIFNAAFGLVLIVLATIASVFFDFNEIISLTLQEIGYMSNATSNIFPIILLMFSFVIAVTNISASSISFEGKNLWIIKTLPVDEKKILKSKVLFSVIIVQSVLTPCLIIMSILQKLSIYQFLMIFILNIVQSFVISLFGVIINLKYPNLEYTTEAQVVKQSMSSFVSAFIPMILIFALVYVYLILNLPVMVFALLLLLCLIIIYFVEVLILNTWGVKKFKKL